MQKRILYLISYIALCIQLHDCFAEKDHAYVKDHSLNSNQVAKQQGVELNLELDYNAVQNVSQYNLLEYDLNIEDGKDYDNSFELAIILEDIDTKLQTPRSNNQKFYKAKDRSVSDEYDNDQILEDIDTKLQTPRSNNQKFYKAKDRSVSDEYDNDQKIEFEF